MPYQLVRDQVELACDEQTVRIFHGATLVATHARSREPYARVLDPAHVAGLWRVSSTLEPTSAPTLAPFGRSLAEYDAIVGGGR